MKKTRSINEMTEAIDKVIIDQAQVLERLQNLLAKIKRD